MDDFLALFELLGVLARRRYQAGERAFAALGLNHSEARLLTLLDRAGGESTQDALSDALHIDRTNAGRALKQLEAGGYVTRRTDRADRRAKFVRLSAKGRKGVAEISKLRVKLAQTFFGDLSQSDARTIVDLFKKSMPQKDAA